MWQSKIARPVLFFLFLIPVVARWLMLCKKLRYATVDFSANPFLQVFHFVQFNGTNKQGEKMQLYDRILTFLPLFLGCTRQFASPLRTRAMEHQLHP